MLRSSLLAASFAAHTLAQGLIPFLESRQDLSTLLGTLQRVPDLLQSLSTAKNITLLAPSNAAFEGPFQDFTTSQEILDGDDTEVLSRLLSYHVLNGTWRAEDLAGPRRLVHTLYDNGLVTGGQIIAASGSVDEMYIDHGAFVPANVNETDITGAGDGIVVHTITTVLDLPKNVSQLAQRYIEKPAILVALERAELLAEIEGTPDVTILDPRVPASTINDIPDDTLADVLRYHIVKDTLYFLTAQIESGIPATLSTLQGGNITVTVEEAVAEFNETFYDGVRVLRGDVIIANGIVHDIERLLDPTRSTTTTTDNSSVSPNETIEGTPAQSTGDGARLSSAAYLIFLLVCAAAMI